MNESTFQKKCITHAKAHGWLAYKFSSPAHRGVPDVIFIRNGEVIFIEFKHPNGKGKISPLQAHTIKEMKEESADVFVIWQWEKFLEIIS